MSVSLNTKIIKDSKHFAKRYFYVQKEKSECEHSKYLCISKFLHQDTLHRSTFYSMQMTSETI